MARAIRITAGEVSAEALLNNSGTATAIWAALPLEAKGAPRERRRQDRR